MLVKSKMSGEFHKAFYFSKVGDKGVGQAFACFLEKECGFDLEDWDLKLVERIDGTKYIEFSDERTIYYIDDETYVIFYELLPNGRFVNDRLNQNEFYMLFKKVD